MMIIDGRLFNPRPVPSGGDLILNLSNLIVTPCDSGKTAIRQAIEDAVVLFVYSFVTALIAIATFDISAKVLYAPLISSLLIGVTTYMRARGITPTGSAVELPTSPSVVPPDKK